MILLTKSAARYVSKLSKLVVMFFPEYILLMFGATKEMLKVGVIGFHLF